ncbi:MAG: hypothetical protein M1820_009465 [Bogoriella megaspora]|nr:MAG: hypothetical protein M1820_009465 [Bogoriella megaspora]
MAIDVPADPVTGTQLSGSQDMVLPLGTQALCQTSFRQQLMSKFLLLHQRDIKSEGRNMMTWLSAVPSLPSPLRAIETSTYALCAARLGQIDGNIALQNEGRRLYGKGLSELRFALTKPQLLYEDETLGACMALAMYEICEGTRSGYVNHADGAGKLIQLRGPTRHVTGLGHNVFLAYRYMGLIRAMELKEHSFLSESVWRSLPWQNSVKGPFDRLVDIVLPAPEILRQAEGLGSESPEQQWRIANELIEQCLGTEAQFELFYRSLDEETPGLLHWPADSVRSPQTPPVIFEFPNITIAAAVITYWAFLFMVRSGLCRLAALLDQLKHHLFPLSAEPEYKFRARTTDLDPQIGFITLARNILSSVEYCSMEDSGGVRVAVILAPLGIVADTLRDWPQFQAEYVQARQALDRVSKLGFKIVQPVEEQGNRG